MERHAKRHPRPMRGAGGLVAVFVFAAGVVIVLSVITVPRVSVAMKVVADEMSLVFDDDWTLTDFPLADARITNLKQLQVAGIIDDAPGGRGGSIQPVDLVLRPQTNVSNWSASLAGEGLRLNLNVPSRTTIGISYRKARGPRLEFIVDCRGTCGSVDSGEKVTVGCSSCADVPPLPGKVETNVSEFKMHLSRRELSLDGNAAPVMISTRVSPDGEGTLELAGGTRLALHEIGFLRKAHGQPTSSISGSGTAAFTSLENSPVPIAAGDFVFIEPAEVLSVRRISVGDSVQVELEGVVKDLRTGPGGLVRSRKPSILAFLYGSKFLQLIVGAVLAFAGAVSAALYRLGFLAKPKS
jgi:hypothetical protein